MKPTPGTTCPLCGGPNGCAPATSGTFETPCWCMTIDVDQDALARLSERERGRACLCRKCATGTLRDTAA